VVAIRTDGATVGGDAAARRDQPGQAANVRVNHPRAQSVVSLEGGTVGVRAGADDPFEAVAEGGGRAESDLSGDAVDGVAGGFDGFQERTPRGGRLVVDDELGLPTFAFQRHDGQPGGVSGYGGAVVATDQVQARSSPAAAPAEVRNWPLSTSFLIFAGRDWNRQGSKILKIDVLLSALRCLRLQSWLCEANGKLDVSRHTFRLNDYSYY
jgi:hypothetical protein